MQYLTTSAVAKTAGIHPNTVRTYEQWGLLQGVERHSNGYRKFTETHILQLKLIRTAFKSTWLGGKIRKAALSVVTASASGNYNEALQNAWLHLDLISSEKARAEEAVVLLEKWASGTFSSQSEPENMTISQAAAKLDVSVDILRNWERNGLIRIPRNLANGYRIFDEAVSGRLLIIRTLRQARYSNMSILRMLKSFDSGKRNNLTEDLNKVPPEDDVFFSTDRWLHKIREIEHYASSMIELLEQAIIKSKLQ
ncbi:MAG: MerR family transcriptional regulator [Firmicutes bacterium]|nr:MerR family transcriptional regulator [Bacillota bacterium]